MRQHGFIFWAAVLVLCCVTAMQTHLAKAESALDLLSGFDAARLEAAFPVDDTTASGEVAKLLFRLRKADESKLSARAKNLPQSHGDIALGEALQISGTIVSMRRFNVPEKLIEFLNLGSFLEITLKPDKSELPIGETVVILAPSISAALAPGDRLSLPGVVLEMRDSEIAAFAAGRFQWFPAKAESTGIELLTRHGLDASAIASVSTRNRQPLMAEDTKAFYPMLLAADRLASQLDAPKPIVLSPIEMLQSPQDHAGDWISIRLNTVRVTRVNITDADVRARLQQDHYFQVDCSGDLGDVVIEMTRPKGDDGEPIRLNHSYPVSVVSLSLPEFLRDSIEGQSDGGSLVTMISHPVRVDGFFFRLWSYDSEFMSRQGAGKQVGPLVMASKWNSLQEADESSGGLEVIGYALAAAIFLCIVATVVWNRVNAQDDRQTRRQQQQRDGEILDFPISDG